MRPAQRAALLSSDVLPSPIGKEPMVRASDELGAVLEPDPIGRLDRCPVRKHLGDDEPTVPTYPLCAVDRVAHTKLDKWPRPPVSHQDRSVARQAVDARVA